MKGPAEGQDEGEDATDTTPLIDSTPAIEAHAAVPVAEPVIQPESAPQPPGPWVPSFTTLMGIAFLSFGCRTWLPLAIGLSKNGKHDLLYSVAFVVAFAETIKLSFCLPILAGQYIATPKKERANFVRFDTKTFFLYAIPATMYQASNLLWFLLIMVINPGLALPLGSIKVLATGVAIHTAAVLPFGRKIFKTLTDVQWLALVILVIGVLLCNPDTIFGSGEKKDLTLKDGGLAEGKNAAGNTLLGLLIALGYSCAGALGNVSCELMFKRPVTSRDGVPQQMQRLWIQNIQLYFWGAVVGVTYLLCKDGKDIIARGPFHDFDHWTWMALSAHVSMGIAASLVFKYLNNIVFLFISVACMLAAALISIPLFHFKFSVAFIIALVLIMAASYLYKREALRKTASNLMDRYAPRWSKGKEGATMETTNGGGAVTA